MCDGRGDTHRMLRRRGRGQPGRCERQQRQRDLFVQQLFTDANIGLIAITAKGKANGESEDRAYLAIFCIPRERVQVSTSDELDDDHVGALRRARSWTKRR